MSKKKGKKGNKAKLIRERIRVSERQKRLLD
jgi:hypothetical protein